MKNTTMMRIIYKPEDTPIKEYLKTFFSYIGLVVYDEKVYKNEKFIQHLAVKNEPDGVDIVINCYTSEKSFGYSQISELQNRIYLYYDTENQICEIRKNPYSSREQILDKKNNISKKEQRIKSLDLLINEIWENDEENRLAIQQIKNCYVPENEDNDLFFMLQELKIIDEMYNNEFYTQFYTILTKKDVMDFDDGKEITGKTVNLKLIINEYLLDIIDELIKISCLFKEDTNENPYIEYIKINNLRLLLLLASNLPNVYAKKLSLKCEKKGLLESNFNKDLKKEYRNFYLKYPWFKGIYFLAFKLGDKSSFDNLIYFFNKSSFPNYYLPVYELLMFSGYDKSNIEVLKEIAQKIIKLPIPSYVLLSKLDLNISLLQEEEMLDRWIEFSHLIFSTPLDRVYIEIFSRETMEEDMNLFFKRKRFKTLSCEDILLYFFWLYKEKDLCDRERRESLKKYIKDKLFHLLFLFEENIFMRYIVNEDEKGYLDFKNYHKISSMCCYLYLLFSTDDYNAKFAYLDQIMFHDYYKIRKNNLFNYQICNGLVDDDIFFLDKEQREKIKEKKLTL